MRFSTKVERCVGSDVVPWTDWFSSERYTVRIKFYDDDDEMVKPVPLGDALIRVLGDISHDFSQMPRRLGKAKDYGV